VPADSGVTDQLGGSTPGLVGVPLADLARAETDGGPEPAGVVLDGAAKSYAAVDGSIVRALAPVSLNIAQGAFVSVVGRSGCGKSTLLKLVAGLEGLTSGTIHIGSELVTAPPDSVRYVFQNFNESLLPWRTVGENVRFGLRHAHGPRQANRRKREDQLIEGLLDEVGLAGTFRKFPGELSGGMQQRVAIARALAASPQVLLLDEPFSAVDALSRATLQELVLRIWQEHRLTILFVTHDIEEALFLSQRVVVLRPQGGGIGRDVTVDIGYPRKQVEFREDERYLARRREVYELIVKEH
jgi:NitT/TauT family transport system ATP-binding protein